MWFGKQIQRPAKITNGGIEFTLKNTDFTYEVPEQEYLQFVGTTGNIIYDPVDMNKVLFTADNGRIRIICDAYQFT